MLRLGVNIDHVATIRNARGGTIPCPVRAALLAQKAGANGITAHLREDRRHIRDSDIERLKTETDLPLNLEMAMTNEMLAIALHTEPHAVCIVPEKREELTTEGGLDVCRMQAQLTPFVQHLQEVGIRVSLFIEPSIKQLHTAKAIGARAVELHTGHYCELTGDKQQAELMRITEAAAQGVALGLEVHAGHGLTYDNVAPIAAIEDIVELNIGHFLVGESVFVGLEAAIQKMRNLMDKAHQPATVERSA